MMMAVVGKADLPVVEKTPPTMPHSRTRNCPRGMCCSLTVTIRELVSYLTKTPDTPWLPAAWFISRSWQPDGAAVSVLPQVHRVEGGGGA